MKDYIVAVLQTMLEKASFVLRLTFREDGKEGVVHLLKMECANKVVMDLDAIASLTDVSNHNEWCFLPERMVVIRTTGDFDKMLFVDLMTSSLENIELLQERQKRPQ